MTCQAVTHGATRGQQRLENARRFCSPLLQVYSARQAEVVVLEALRGFYFPDRIENHGSKALIYSSDPRVAEKLPM